MLCGVCWCIPSESKFFSSHISNSTLPSPSVYDESRTWIENGILQLLTNRTFAEAVMKLIGISGFRKPPSIDKGIMISSQS